MRALCLVPLLVAACSGGGDDAGEQTALACEDISTAAVNEVAADDWPDASIGQIIFPTTGTYEGLGGGSLAGQLFEDVNNSCGDPTNVKITTFSAEEIEIVQDPWPTSVDCGCTVDPLFDADSKMQVIALHQVPERVIEVFVETFDDPVVQGRINFDSSFMAFYGPNEPLEWRACLSDSVDDFEGSDFETYDIIVRKRRGSANFEIDLILTPREGDPTTCELRIAE